MKLPMMKLKQKEKLIRAEYQNLKEREIKAQKQLD
jgi:hypothetical protein